MTWFSPFNKGGGLCLFEATQSVNNLIDKLYVSRKLHKPFQLDWWQLEVQLHVPIDKNIYDVFFLMRFNRSMVIKVEGFLKI